METTYRLKPNLTWHDGTPFTTDDYVFAFQVYGGPELGLARSEPQRRIQEVLAPDSRTLVIRWREPYPDADLLASASSSGAPFVPLPRHILEEALLRGNPDAFAAQPYWTSEYVGLGPYRLDNWERGAFFEASAFDAYVLGRPKIDRLRVNFVTDPNTVMANLLAGSADMVAESTLRIEQGVLLRRDWEPRGAGVVKFFPSGGRRATLQFDPARVSPQALLDVRVRRVLAHAIDKEALNEALLDGLGRPADTWVQPTVDYFPEVERAIAKYPHDLRIAAQRLAEAGFDKGTDGIYSSPVGGKLAIEISHANDTQYNKEAAIMADGLNRFGIETSLVPMAPRGVTTGSEVDFSALRNGGGGSIELHFGTGQIPRAENRFTGNNVGAWLNPEYERLQAAFGATLDRTQRNGHLVQMAKLISEEVPQIPLYYNAGAVAYAPDLHNVIAGDRIGAFWNVHLWEFR
jgi:peptide/nickel transport system substrate-binding protein